MRLLLRTMLAALLAGAGLMVACGCDGAVHSVDQPAGGRLASPEMLSVGAKSASGVPSGISVTWTRVAGAQGYYLYRYTNDNRPPEPEPDDDPPFPVELRVNDGDMIMDPGAGTSVTHNDLFPAVVGETYFYRVTAVDTHDPPQEGYPSAEASWTVNGHTVSSLNPTSAYWGDEITIARGTDGLSSRASREKDFTSNSGGCPLGRLLVPDRPSTGGTATSVPATALQKSLRANGRSAEWLK